MTRGASKAFERKKIHLLSEKQIRKARLRFPQKMCEDDSRRFGYFFFNLQVSVFNIISSDLFQNKKRYRVGLAGM